ncbi:hypothetical protein LY90DRAFT_696630 [Neocallimastix californiae]|jgi:signal recognition particle subunit SEC65|uniref:Uncharacterized protein n=1 Tax=Neocallimastix californiae TaxID=1754190 RepID=A0A1Y2FV67_9FUNG|nr:hypothetical protein LY90DRAFT_696630 [Neocallimastix californiae]|eukprot:ORY87194.1 hypothetical protein LY90DRAFT_696630 [Neocallimastix californiae]
MNKINDLKNEKDNDNKEEKEIPNETTLEQKLVKVKKEDDDERGDSKMPHPIIYSFQSAKSLTNPSITTTPTSLNNNMSNHESLNPSNSNKSNRSYKNGRKSLNASSVQWITIEEIKKTKKIQENHQNSTSNQTSTSMFFEITPIKSYETKEENQHEHYSTPINRSTTLSSLTTTPITKNNEILYTTPQNTIHPGQEESETKPFIESSSSKITSFISNITRRTSRRLRQSFGNL